MYVVKDLSSGSGDMSTGLYSGLWGECLSYVNAVCLDVLFITSESIWLYFCDVQGRQKVEIMKPRLAHWVLKIPLFEICRERAPTVCGCWRNIEKARKKGWYLSLFLVGKITLKDVVCRPKAAALGVTCGVNICPQPTSYRHVLISNSCLSEAKNSEFWDDVIILFFIKFESFYPRTSGTHRGTEFSRQLSFSNQKRKALVKVKILIPNL